jgi:hypothetical protein
MTTPWRRLALTAALLLTVGSGVAAAQMVTVRNAPPGAPIEILFDGSPLVSGKADNAGDAKLGIMLQLTKGDWESDVRMYVDVCGEAYHIGLVDRLSLSPTPADGCERREVSGLFVIKAATNLLVDVAAGRALVYLRQGPLPKAWMLSEKEAVEQPLRLRRPAPTGLVAFAGAGRTRFGTGLLYECGDVVDCKPDNASTSFTVGASIWVTRWLAVEGGYVKPESLKISGSGGNFRFNSSLETQFITAVGKIGIPIGPFRPYGIAGANYHRSLRTTNQVNDEETVTEGDVTVTYPANTQTWASATDGVSWLFGGGAEFWLSKRIGLYGEITRGAVKGSGLNSTEGKIDDRITCFWGGARVKIGK